MRTVFDREPALHSVPTEEIDVVHMRAELDALRKQGLLDRQSRDASQAEFARLNRELNEERSRVGVLLDEIASVAIAAGMMDPARRGSLDGPNAIQFLRQMKEEFERNRA
jgi:hypothetical protein